MPANHVYVRHLSALTKPDPVVRLPEPHKWWPPVMLGPGWVRDHRDEFDVFHLHFGFDALRPQQLQELVDELREAGKPLVYTVHDLRNPHHLSADLHLDQLDVLVPAADALVTLTPGAAAFIDRRWHREALVLPHPHVAPFEEMTPRRAAAPDDTFVIGLHAKSLRAALNPLPVLEALVETVADLPGCQLRVNIHGEVMASSGERHSPELTSFLQGAAAAGLLTLDVHEYLDDEALWTYLRGLDLSVLPYRFGTHSGWLEACYDLGTTVLAPSCGYYAEQRPCLRYDHDESGFDAGSLTSAVRHAYEERPRWQASIQQRRLERGQLAQAHQELYQDVLNRVGAVLSPR